MAWMASKRMMKDFLPRLFYGLWPYPNCGWRFRSWRAMRSVGWASAVRWPSTAGTGPKCNRNRTSLAAARLPSNPAGPSGRRNTHLLTEFYPLHVAVTIPGHWGKNRPFWNAVGDGWGPSLADRKGRSSTAPCTGVSTARWFLRIDRNMERMTLIHIFPIQWSNVTFLRMNHGQYGVQSRLEMHRVVGRPISFILEKFFDISKGHFGRLRRTAETLGQLCQDTFAVGFVRRHVRRRHEIG